MTNQQANALIAWREMMEGKRVVVSDETLDTLADALTGDDADLFFRHCASIPNPGRVGVRDQYIAWLKDVTTTA